MDISGIMPSMWTFRKQRTTYYGRVLHQLFVTEFRWTAEVDSTSVSRTYDAILISKQEHLSKLKHVRGLCPLCFLATNWEPWRQDTKAPKYLPCSTFYTCDAAVIVMIVEKFLDGFAGVPRWVEVVCVLTRLLLASSLPATARKQMLLMVKVVVLILIKVGLHADSFSLTEYGVNSWICFCKSG